MVGPVKKAADLAFGHCRERLLDFILVAAVQNQDRLSDRPGGCFNLAELLRRRLVLRTDEKGNQTGLREDFAQQFQALRNYLGPEDVPSRRVASRPVEACDETQLHRVTAGGEHDRNGCGRLLRRPCRGRPGRDQQRRRKRDQLGRERRQTIEASLGESVLDRNIPADDEARLFQSVQKPGPQRCFSFRGAAAEISDDRQARLRRGPKRRKRGRAADQREELAALHVWMAPALQEVTR